MKDKYDLVIAGSGISGMSLAYYCSRNNLKVLVIEKHNTLGGSFTTETVDNFWIELGAHTLYNSYGNLIDIIRGSGIRKDIIKRKKVPYKAFKNGKVRSVISQFNILELLISVPSLFRVKKDNQTVESYYSRIVGKRNYRKFFQYMFNAVPSQKTNDFPANILFKKRNRRKDILKSFTLENGLKSIIDAIANMPEVDTLTNTAISSLARMDTSFEVSTDNKQTFEASFVALATPVNVTTKLINTINPAISELLGKIKYTQTESMGVVIKKEDIDFKEIAGIVGIDADFYSVVSRDVVENDLYRGFVFHFKPDKFDDKAKINSICKILNIPENKLINVISKQNTVPSFRLGHEEIIKEIDNLLKEEHILVTGNYFSGMAIEDCVSRSLSEFKRLHNYEQINI